MNSIHKLSLLTLFGGLLNAISADANPDSFSKVINNSLSDRERDSALVDLIENNAEAADKAIVD